MSVEDMYIRIWPWRDAPERYCKLSQHGGDEDWVAEVPEHLRDRWYLYVPQPVCDGRCRHHLIGGRIAAVRIQESGRQWQNSGGSCNE